MNELFRFTVFIYMLFVLTNRLLYVRMCVDTRKLHRNTHAVPRTFLCRSVMS